jgi:hypothetical protein
MLSSFEDELLNIICLIHSGFSEDTNLAMLVITIGAALPLLFVDDLISSINMVRS